MVELAIGVCSGVGGERCWRIGRSEEELVREGEGMGGGESV